MKTRVMKFGGTSVANAEALAQVAAIIQKHAADGNHTVAVVSAMSGVTDALTRGVRAAADGNNAECRAVADEILHRICVAAERLIPTHDERAVVLAQVEETIAAYISICESVHVLAEVTPRVLDRATSCGEPLVALLLAAHLSVLGTPAQAVNPEHIIATDDSFQNAVPLQAETQVRCRTHVAPLISAGVIPVIGGFIGATTGGVPTTLGRGGSDFSAAILGQAVGADEVWIWTDVDGVMTADPRLVPSAKVIPTLSYGEVGELAYFGAAVLHPRTIRPLVDARIPLWIKNTFRPDAEGTYVSSEARQVLGMVKAVTEIRDLSMVTVKGRGRSGVRGIVSRTSEAVERCKANVLFVSQASSQQSICFVMPGDEASRVRSVLEEEFALELSQSEIDRIGTLRRVSVVTALGSGVRGAAGVAGRLFTGLAKHGVNTIAMAQGASECSVSVVVSEHDVENAVHAIHEEVMSQ